MKLHRNSQKRFYVKGYTYFVTGVTQNRVPYFVEEIFCEVFWENLKTCQELKRFELHGWFLGYEHFHMLVTPGDGANISKIMQFLKRHVSRNINDLMDQLFEGEIGQSRLQNCNNEMLQSKIEDKNAKLEQLRQKFHQKHSNPHLLLYPKFQWQRSFHDHVIRNEQDFENHMRYIQKNPTKHEMPEGWRWWALNI